MTWQYPITPTPKQREALKANVDELLWGGSVGGGKALALDTPMLTPAGWTTHGALQPGDRVYGVDGQPVQVVATSPVYHVPTYAVRFSNGERIICSEGHLWAIQDEKSRRRFEHADPEWKAARRAKRPRRGTSDARAAHNARRAALARANEAPPDVWDYTTVTETRHLDLTGRQRLSIPCGQPTTGAAPWQSTIPPWAYGMWMGDGGSYNGYITHGDDDADELIQNMRRVGIDLDDRRKYEFKFRTPQGRTFRSVIAEEQGRKTRDRLSKSIPDWMYTTSTEDREALLAGLIDADGHVNERGQVEFCVTDRELAHGFRRLAATLGHRAGITEREAAYRKSGQRHVTGTRYTVKFTPDKPVARYKRKQGHSKRTARTTSVYILSAEHVETVPTSCIQVDDPRGLYLAGDTLIPTHNSEMLLAAGVVNALLVPNSRTLLIRRTFPELHEFVMRLRQRIPTSAATYNKQERIFRFVNGAELQLGYLAKDDDVYQYQGGEFSLILFDELTHYSSFQYTFLISRLRATGAVGDRLRQLRLKPRAISASNPGGRGHSWVRERFIEPAPPGTVHTDRQSGASILYLPAKLTDNPYLDVEDYLKKLNVLDPVMRRAMIDGDWDILLGAVRFPQWRRHLHVVDPDEYPIDITEHPRAVGVDYGVADPFAAVWGARMPDDTLVIYREAVETDLTASEQAQLILDLEVEGERAPRRPLPVAADRSMWNRTGRSGAKLPSGDDRPDPGSIAHDYYKKFGSALRKSNSDRLAGWAMIDKLLRPRPCDGHCGTPDCEGHPRLIVYSTCTNLINDLASLPRSKNNPEDAETTGVDDHSCLVAGTTVATEDGAVPIEEVRAGDRVWTREGLRTVQAAGMTGRDGEVGTVVLSGGRTITGTPDHPVWVEGHGWVGLGRLRYMDRVVTRAGTVTVSLAWWPRGRADVYNLTVEGVPEFFANGVLVHNCDAARYLAMELMTRPVKRASALPDPGRRVVRPETAGLRTRGF